MRKPPEFLDVASVQLEDVLLRLEQALDEKDFELVRAVFHSYAYLAEMVEDKNTSIRRLRQLLFGARTETTEAVVGSKGTTPETAAASEAQPKSASAGRPEASDTKPAPKGHGRNAAEAYRGATRIDVPHPSLQPGDACPACGQGTVYEKPPGLIVRITGQPPLAAKVYQLQKLRCHLCGEIFTAPAPADAGPRKYDATAGSMIGLLKYGSGLPFNRLEGLQGDLEVPLPASTQWDIVHEVAASLTPAFEELVRQAAQGEVVHNDDTTIKILELMRSRAQAGAEGEATPRRARACSPRAWWRLRDGHQVALFFSGRRHAGENLAEVLKHRAEELPPPIQMCDALARNLPGELRTIVGHCLAHARRRFVDDPRSVPRAVRPPPRIARGGLSPRCRRRASEGSRPRHACTFTSSRARRRWRRCTTG